MTASSYQVHWTWDREPHFARSNYNNKFWASDKDDSDPWIQVYLGASYVVNGLVFKWHTDTGAGKRYWVEKMKIKLGMSQECIEFIKDDDGLPKVRFLSGVI